MKILNKIIIISFILNCFLFSFTSANDSDCENFVHLKYENSGTNGFDIVNNYRGDKKNDFTDFLTTEEKNAIITKDDLNTAILNLKKQCCQKENFSKLTTCTEENIFFNENTLESENLFDHLFDVIMRRLNGSTGDNDIYKKTNMSVDPLGAERRSRINSQAESTKGSTPYLITNKYNQFRQQSSPDKGYNINGLISWNFSKSNQNYLNFVNGKGEDTQNSKAVAKALKEYNKRTLYDRYQNSCALTEYFYVLLSQGKSDNSEENSEIRSNISKCNEFIKKQIGLENEYVQLIKQESANRFLSNYLEGYISYMYGRQQTLQKTRKDTTGRRIDIVRAVPCLQKICPHY